VVGDNRANGEPRRARLWGSTVALLAVLTLSLGLAVHTLFPTLRSSHGWSVSDLGRVLGGGNHWCGRHGHVQGHGSRLTCRGSQAGFFAQVVVLHAEGPEVDKIVVGLTESEDEDLAWRAAELCGVWSLSEAKIPLVRQAERLNSGSAGPALESVSWALEQLQASEAVPVLLRHLDAAGFYRVHAIANLGTSEDREALRVLVQEGGTQEIRDLAAKALLSPQPLPPLGAPHAR
jgi:hypothetical protein